MNSYRVLVHHLLDNIDDSSLAKNKQKKKSTALQTKWQEMQSPENASSNRGWSAYVAVGQWRESHLV